MSMDFEVKDGKFVEYKYSGAEKVFLRTLHVSKDGEAWEPLKPEEAPELMARGYDFVGAYMYGDLRVDGADTPYKYESARVWLNGWETRWLMSGGKNHKDPDRIGKELCGSKAKDKFCWVWKCKKCSHEEPGDKKPPKCCPVCGAGVSDYG